MNQTKTKLFKIGSFIFDIIFPEDFIIPTNFQKFMISDGLSSYHYVVKYSEELPRIQGNVLAHRQDILILSTPTGEARYIGAKNDPIPYALYREISPTQAEIFFDSSQSDYLVYDPFFTSLFALEKRMFEQKSMIFHCAYTEYKGQALLFSAPSETGKTTQANLWKKYRSVETINGDRALLQFAEKEDKWYANGWPVCGTSEICTIKKLPIGAIVMLSQSKDGRNTIRRLQGMEAFRLIYSQITVNTWNAAATGDVMTWIEQLIGHVPIYHLTCTISEKAVEVLENILNREKQQIL